MEDILEDDNENPNESFINSQPTDELRKSTLNISIAFESKDKDLIDAINKIATNIKFTVKLNGEKLQNNKRNLLKTNENEKQGFKIRENTHSSPRKKGQRRESNRNRNRISKEKSSDFKQLDYEQKSELKEKRRLEKEARFLEKEEKRVENKVRKEEKESKRNNRNTKNINKEVGENYTSAHDLFLKSVSEHLSNKMNTEIKDCEPDRKQRRQLSNETRNENYKIIEAVVLKELPDFVDTLWFDSSTMLNCDAVLKKRFHYRRNKAFENVLVSLGIAFAKTAKIKNLVVVFESTNKIYSKSEEGLNIQVCSAKPNFASVDDALVCLIKEEKEGDLNQSVVVTAAKDLILRLANLNVRGVIQSGVFFGIVRQLLSENVVDKIILD